MADRRSPRSRAEEVFADFLRRRGCGELVDPEALCREHPELAAELRALHSTHATGPGREPPGPGTEADSIVSLADEPAPEAGAPRSLLEKLRSVGLRDARYKILSEIGRGGMGQVLRIWDDELRRTLAMKVVLGSEEAQSDAGSLVDPRLLARFLEEAQITGQLDHPGIVPVHELGLGQDGRVYFTMRLVRGEDLRTILDHVRTGQDGWSQVRALGVMLRVCEAMSYAHSKQVVHRDLKPANVMVGRFGEVYVMDWGLARVLGREDKHDLRFQQPSSSSVSVVKTERREDRERTPDSPLVTLDGDVVGTPSFMPPEQAQGLLEKIGPHSDVYAVGAMLYQLVSGQMPYVPPDARVSPRSILMRMLEGPPRPLHELAPDTPAELIAISEKAMAREIPNRYPTMQTLADDLRAYVEGRVVGAYETGALAELRKWVTRNRSLATALAAAVLLLVLGVVMTAREARRADKKASEAEKAHQEAAARNAELASANTTIQATNQELTDAKTELEEANASVQRTNEVLRASNEELIQARNLAQGRSYRANFLSAEYSLRLHDSGAARRWMEACDSDLRRFEWAHLRLKLDGSRRLLSGHSDQVHCVAFSPGGAHVASASQDGSIRLWDAESGDVRDLGAPGAGVNSIDFSHSGALLASGGDDGLVRIWSVATGEVLHELKALGKAVHCVAFDSADSRVAAGSEDDAIFIWELPPGRAPARVLAHAHPVLALDFDEDGTRLASGTSQGVVTVWNLATGEKRETPMDGGAVWSVAFSPDGERILSAAEDGRIGLWGAASGVLERTLQGHEGAVYAARFSPDGRLVCSGAEDATVRIWDALSGETVAVLFGHTQAVHSVAFDSGGTEIASGGWDDSIRIWDRECMEPVTVLRGHEGPVLSVACTPDGKRIASGSKDKSVRIWDGDSGELLSVIETRLSPVVSVSIREDGRRVVANAGRSTLRTWDCESGEKLTATPKLEGDVTTVDYDPAGRRIAFGAKDRTVRVCDAESGAELRALRGHEGSVTSVAWAPDGTRLASGSMDRSVRAWSAETGELLFRIPDREKSITSVAWSRDGRRLVSAAQDGSVCVWDDDAKAVVARMSGHVGPVASAAFNEDGARIVSGGRDGTLRLWDVESQETLLVLTGHAGPVNSVVFSHDGRRVISGSEDGTVRIWETSEPSVRHQARVAAEGVRRAASPR